jgi:hypothetical protein
MCIGTLTFVFTGKDSTVAILAFVPFVAISDGLVACAHFARGLTLLRNRSKFDVDWFIFLFRNPEFVLGASQVFSTPFSVFPDTVFLYINKKLCLETEGRRTASCGPPFIC